MGQSLTSRLARAEPRINTNEGKDSQESARLKLAREAYNVFEKHHQESERITLKPARFLLLPLFNVVFYKFAKWYYLNHRHLFFGRVGKLNRMSLYFSIIA